MRVLLTADAVGGVFTYALDLAEALRPRGVEVVLALAGCELSPAQRAAAEAVCAEVHVRPYRLIWMQDPWQDVRASRRWLAELAARSGADLVHANDYGLADGGWEVPTLLVGHSCVLSWWEAVRGESAPAQWSRYRDAVTRALARADLVVAPSEAMRHALDFHYGPLRASRVVANGASRHRFAPLAKLPYVLTCGRLWDEGKDVATLARAAMRSPWPVLAVGADRHAEGRRAPLGALHGLGTLSRHAVAAWMGGASIYAHPARYEPFGLAPLEAALSGCALVLAQTPTLVESWEGVARFFPPGDDEALASVLRQLARDASSRRRLGQAARERAHALSLERMAERYHALYRELARARSAAPEPVASSPSGGRTRDFARALRR